MFQASFIKHLGLIGFMLLAGLGFLEGQMSFPFKAITTNEGLSQGYIWDIIQDKDGFLWVSTKAGLNRYDGYGFKVYSHDAFDPHSISSNAVLYLFEDSKGRIWIGSDNGLNIFDKKTEKCYRLLHDPKNANSLSSNLVDEQIAEMEDGRFLVNTSHEYFDIVSVPDNFFTEEKNLKIEHIKKPRNSFNPKNYYNEIVYTDMSNITWYNCDDRQYQFNPKTNQFEYQKNITLGGQVIANEDGSFWANDNVISFHEGSNVYPLFSKPIYNDQTGAMLKEDNRRLWRSIGNLRVLEVFDISKWQKGKPLDPSKCIIDSDHNVAGNIFYKDRTGLVWLGLNGHGLRKYSLESEKFNHIIKNSSIDKFFPYGNDVFYFKSYSPNFKIAKEGKEIFNPWVEAKVDVIDFFISKAGDLWLTKRHDINTFIISEIEQINLKTGKSKTFKVDLKGNYNHSQHILEDNNAYLWIGGIDGYISVFDPSSGRYKEFILPNDSANPLAKLGINTAIYQSENGTTWIGTLNGFAKIESKDILHAEHTVTWYKNEINNLLSLNNNSVSSFLDDPIDKGLLWVATKGGGLNLMDKTSAKMRHITTKQGLCDNTVYGILSDDMGNIWGSTNNGLFCILANNNRTGNFEFRHFTEAAGLQSAEFNTNAYRKLPNGHLAFGGINGLNVFNPKEILVDTFAPQIFITKLLIGNTLIQTNDESNILKTAIEYTQEITLHHTQDVFTLEFASLDFRAPDQIKYRYQLEGSDDAWIESGNRRNVTYSHLPSGTYIFKVQGSNSLGIWNDNVKSLSIKMLPPWWATWFAYLCYACLIGLGIRTYYLYKLNQTKMETQLVFEQKESTRIKELDKIKTLLYTNMTHEFRTPLTVILGMVQQIRRSTTDHLETGLDMIERNGNNLLNLVNEMLDLSKLEAGKMELNLIQGDVINFIRYIVESFHSLAEGQEKKMHYLSNLDVVYASFDAEKLRQIITNLLSNALKFTPIKGDIYVSISWENEHKSNLCIKIKDTGIGIPEHQILHIFDRFYQADSSHTRKAEGTGIGLSLTKELVQLMKGTISVKSPPIGAKKGTEFTVILPLDILDGEVDQLDAKSINAQTVPTSLDSSMVNKLMIANESTGKELILLVEDNADVVAYTASCLQDYRLAVGKDGQEGYDIACEMIPDLIITDVMMPYMDGFEMTKKLRLDERTSHIPIIILTAKADMESRLEGIEYGAEVYLEKPFYKDELLLRIKKLLEQRKFLQQYYGKQIGISTAQVEEPIQKVDVPVVSTIENDFVRKVREIVENNFTNYEFNVEQLCKTILMSHSQLHRKLDALTGCSPNKFIRIIRLNKAKQLLTETDATISAVAMDCGYNDPGYFARIFKQEMGVTPQEWRNRG